MCGGHQATIKAKSRDKSLESSVRTIGFVSRPPTDANTVPSHDNTKTQDEQRPTTSFKTMPKKNHPHRPNTPPRDRHCATTNSKTIFNAQPTSTAQPRCATRTKKLPLDKLRECGIVLKNSRSLIDKSNLLKKLFKDNGDCES